MSQNEKTVFALDIGTRTIVGLVMKCKNEDYEIIASEVIEHEKRAMLDGQIHNVNEVARQVNKVKNKLEQKLETKLKKVAIAAAGRALKTVIKDYQMEFPGSKIITAKDVETLELSAVQEAQEELALDNSRTSPGDYHFVGYSVVEYYLEDIFLADLVGQRGKSIQTKIVATFLPRIVIDSLLSVIDQVGLEIEHLTLEPIAAANIVIPREMHNFNLALVDIGAGTSDIALTKGGSMTGYAMVPVAGDEITETLAEHYLLDYDTGERVKRQLAEKEVIKTRNILGKELEINCEEALSVILPQVNKLAGLISSEIININTDPPQAVFCIGGGALTPQLMEELAGQLELDPERIGIKESNDLKKVTGKIAGVNSAQTLTPIGIAVISQQSQQKAVFFNVEVNGDAVQFFTLNQPTISDVLLAAEINIKNLIGSPGMGLTCTVNGELKTIKGTMGQPGYILLNGEKAELTTPVTNGDQIEYEAGQDGEDALAVIADILPSEICHSREIRVNDRVVELKPQVFQNGSPVHLDSPVEDGADINFNKAETIREGVAQLLEVYPETLEMVTFKLNGEKKQVTRNGYIIRESKELVELESPLEDGLNLEITQVDSGKITAGAFCRQKEDNEITFSFNGSQLTMPCNISIIECNGQEVGTDYEIKEGDNLSIKNGQLNVNQVLKYINYNLSPDMKEEIKLLINDRPASFDDGVSSGDNILIEFS